MSRVTLVLIAIFVILILASIYFFGSETQEMQSTLSFRIEGEAYSSRAIGKEGKDLPYSAGP